MSVLIKGMEMPKSCSKCKFRKTELQEDPDWCLISGESLFYSTGNDCPLVRVPPHGRLIDADALLSQYEGNIWTAKTDYAEGLRDVVADIKAAPTIIPAEEDE